MNIIISFLVGVLAGAIGGILAYRNNASKISAVEAKVGKVVEDIKK